jgi:hypothetical protein
MVHLKAVTSYLPAQGLASGAKFTFPRSNISGIDRAEKVAVYHVDPGVAVAVAVR